MRGKKRPKLQKKNLKCWRKKILLAFWTFWAPPWNALFTRLPGLVVGKLRFSYMVRKIEKQFHAKQYNTIHDIPGHGRCNVWKIRQPLRRNGLVLEYTNLP